MTYQPIQQKEFFFITPFQTNYNCRGWNLCLVLEHQENVILVLSLFMMETCAPVSSNNIDGLLLNLQLTVHLSPTNSATPLVLFTVNIVE